MNSHVQQLQLANWQVGAKGLVGHLSNPLYCSWMLEMYHIYIRGQNSHYKKLVWNERIKEGSKNAPKANLTPCWHANVISENVLKEAINIACKAYFAVRSIWTFDRPRVGGGVKKWFEGRGCLPLLIGSRDKKKKTLPIQIPWCDMHFVQFKEEKLIQLGLFFLERNRNFVYHKDFGRRRVT